MKYLWLIVLLASHLGTSAQVFKFRAFKAQVVIKDKNEEFVCTSDWTTLSSLIVINVDAGKIDIYNEKPTSFDFLKVQDTYFDMFKSQWVIMSCVDQDGKKCQIRENTLTKTADDGECLRLYIDYLGMSYVYKVKKNN